MLTCRHGVQKEELKQLLVNVRAGQTVFMEFERGLGHPHDTILIHQLFIEYIRRVTDDPYDSKANCVAPKPLNYQWQHVGVLCTPVCSKGGRGGGGRER